MSTCAAIGSTTLQSVGASCDGQIYSFGTDLIPGGISDYSYGGRNVVRLAMSNGVVFLGSPIVIRFSYVMRIDVVAVSGAPQTGVISHALEQQVVARLIGPAGFDVTNIDVTFDFLKLPPQASGAAIGPDDSATSANYTVKTDARGIARATVVLGNREGEYVVRATTPVSTTGSPATFNVTARKPAAIKITLDEPVLANAKSSYVVSLLQEPIFHAVGVDDAGAKIGRVRCDWSVATSGPAAGAASAEPVEETPQTTFRPSGLGKVKLVANPALSGVGTAKVDILIGGVLVDVNGDLTPANVHDDLPKFVPGSTLEGESLPLPSVTDGEIQKIQLYVLNGRNRGSVTLTLSEVSTYPGVAMNHPVSAASTTNDLDFGPEASLSCLERRCITVPFADSGATAATLYVRDYAARGKLTAQITVGNSTYEQVIRLPRDANVNRIPDGGWFALTNSATNTFTPIPDTLPAGDSDSDPQVSGLPSQGILGDGLTAFEEYRGFVVRGKHRRLSPARKDLFVVVDPVDDPFDDRITELPLAVHEIPPGEAKGPLSPEINPNRNDSMTGATLQRGVRVRLRFPSPTYERLDGTVVAADFEALAYTFKIGDNVNHIDGHLASLSNQ